jgi:hypothetical protein
MKSKELKATLALLGQVLAEPGLETVHREKLRKGSKELEKAGRSGKPDHRKYFKATLWITSALIERLSIPEVSSESGSSEVER